jgi:hypothetical protein
MAKKAMRADEKSVQEHPVEGQHFRDEPGVTPPDKSAGEVAAERVATARAARDHDSTVALSMQELRPPGRNTGLGAAAQQPYRTDEMPITESERRARDGS